MSQESTLPAPIPVPAALLIIPINSIIIIPINCIIIILIKYIIIISINPNPSAHTALGSAHREGLMPQTNELNIPCPWEGLPEPQELFNWDWALIGLDLNGSRCSQKALSAS